MQKVSTFGTVLIIDDNVPMLKLYEQILMGENFTRVLKAATREEALAGLSAPPLPSLILIDYFLPGSSGEEVLDELRAAHPKKMAAIPVVGFSSLPPGTAMLSSFEAKVSAYLEKTHDIDAFVRMVKETVRNHQFGPAKGAGVGNPNEAQ